MKTPRIRRKTAETNSPQIEDDDAPEAQVIASLMYCLPVKRRRIQIASAIFRAIEIGSIPHVSFDYP
jgi:hypothetical protein